MNKNRNIFSNIIVINIFPIIIINLLIMIIDFNSEFKEQIVQNNILSPYFNTIFLLIVNVHYVFKYQTRYFIKNTLYIIISNIFAHILSYINWWIWINSISSSAPKFMNIRNIQFGILLFLINLMIIIISGIIIQIILLIFNKKSKNKTNGT